MKEGTFTILAADDEVETLGGWVEELDTDYTVLHVYGDKKTKDTHYTEKQLLGGAAQMNEHCEYYLYWQKKEGGYYLICYPKGAFSVLYSFDVGWVFESNLNTEAMLILVILLMLDLLGVSFYISRKIRRTLNNLISGMKQGEQGEEQVELSMQTEKEFSEIQEQAVYVKGDEKLLARVISNLLTNAKKYNRTGKQIKLVLETRKQKMTMDMHKKKEGDSILEQEQDVVAVSLLDDGALIEASVRETMFHAFVRGESARSTKGGQVLDLRLQKQ